MDCRAFGRMAENINKYLTKGRPIFMEGRLTFESWTAQDGTKRSRHRVTVENFQFLPDTPGTGTESFDQNAGAENSQIEQPAKADDIPF